MRNWKSLWVAVLAAFVFTVPALAQDAGAGRRGIQRGGERPAGERVAGQARGERPARDPAEAQRRMEEFRAQAGQRMKERLGCTDEEWKVLEGRVEAVRTAQNNLRGGGAAAPGFGGQFGGRQVAPPRGERPGAPEPSEVVKKTEALRTLLDSEAPKADAIKTALADLRAARKKAQQDLTAAQKSLRDGVKQPRQEAMLVLMGLLE